LIGFGEKVVQAAIVAGIQSFTQNLSTFVPDLFAQLSSAEQTRISNWFGNSSNRINVVLGYLQVNQVLPAVGIVLAAEDEIRDEQIIGSLGQVQFGNNTTNPVTPYQVQKTTYMRSLYRCDCVADNQEFLLWLQALVKWSLLTQRDAMESQYQMLNAKISAADVAPMEEAVQGEAVWPYHRVVTLAVDHFDTWNSVPNSNLLNQVVIQLSAQP
jgi:hypothetical protein